MIEIPNFQGKKVAVFGLGKTGISVCESLVASGAEVFCWDESLTARERTANTKYASEHPKEWPWQELAALVLSPGVPLTHPKPHVIVRKARQENVDVIGDIELFSRAVAAKPVDRRPRVIAVTGSNGKSTTTALIKFILKESGKDVCMGGNIGVPLLDLPAISHENVYVLELSSYQLDLTTSFHADVAVLLNISPDHIERHGSMAGYIAAKKRIFCNQEKGNMAIIGVDDVSTQSICAELNSTGKADVTAISASGALGQGVFGLDGRLFYSFGEKNGEAGAIDKVASLRGSHNLQNAAAALAVAVCEGIDPSVACSAMQRFEGLPHRMEVVAVRNGVTFINDSKATNAEAAEKALQSFDNIYWVAGGRPKEGGIKSIVKQLENVRGAYFFGEAAPIFESQVESSFPSIRCADLETAVSRAAKDANQSGLKNTVVLLSPAAASFDQFSNFETRGDAFRSAVQVIVQEDGAAA